MLSSCMTAIGFTHGLDLGNGFAHSPELNAASIGAIAAQLVSTACGGLVITIGASALVPDDGQISDTPVQPPLQKYSRSLLTQITSSSSPSRPTQRGVSRSSRTLVRDAMDAGGATDERVTCGRRSRVVLTPRRWRQVGESDFTGDGGNKARSPGRARRNPLKLLRREGRVFR